MITTHIQNWNIEELTGYKPQTTFFIDFSIAERFGYGAIRDTFVRAFDEWKTNYVYLTELVMVLNWKMWEHSEDNILLSKLYQQLWAVSDLYAQDNLKGNELQYFYSTTD